MEFKRAIVAKSLIAGASVSRIAREFDINANQVFAWRKQLADMQGTVTAKSCQLLPVTVLESPGPGVESATPTPGAIVLTVGRAQLWPEGDVDAAALAQVLARLLP